ncbi:MAG: DUF72 domain-containing protein [Planctomycetota bacterium]
MAGSFRAGTSGYSYNHWNGVFYPKGTKSAGRLAYYATRFNAVEINMTFYRLPSVEIVRRWCKAVGRDFLFVLKLNRQITHIRQLRDIAEPLSEFQRITEPFGNALGVVLAQLPPSLSYDAELLATFATQARKRWPLAIEFRNESWYREETYQTLRETGAAFVIHDMPGRPSPGRGYLGTRVPALPRDIAALRRKLLGRDPDGLGGAHRPVVAGRAVGPGILQQ